MAVQQRRVSKTRKNKRRSHMHLDPVSVTRCAHCNKLISLHMVCPYCGYYKGKQIINFSEE